MKSRRGFTAIELFVVIMIVAILIALILPVALDAYNRSRSSQKAPAASRLQHPSANKPDVRLEPVQSGEFQEREYEKTFWKAHQEHEDRIKGLEARLRILEEKLGSD